MLDHLTTCANIDLLIIFNGTHIEGFLLVLLRKITSSPRTKRNDSILNENVKHFSSSLCGLFEFLPFTGVEKQKAESLIAIMSHLIFRIHTFIPSAAASNTMLHTFLMH